MGIAIAIAVKPAMSTIDCITAVDFNPTRYRARRQYSCARQFLSGGDRSVTSILFTHFDHSSEDRSRFSAATASFATSPGLANTARARTTAVSVNDFRNRDDCFSLSGDRFAEYGRPVSSGNCDLVRRIVIE